MFYGFVPSEVCSNNQIIGRDTISFVRSANKADPIPQTTADEEMLQSVYDCTHPRIQKEALLCCTANALSQKNHKGPH